MFLQSHHRPVALTAVFIILFCQNARYGMPLRAILQGKICGVGDYSINLREIYKGAQNQTLWFYTLNALCKVRARAEKFFYDTKIRFPRNWFRSGRNELRPPGRRLG